MAPRPRRLARAVGAAALALAALAGCEQGAGQRCQVDADCASGYICSRSEGVCSTTNGTGSVDAEPAKPPHDAAIDAP